MKLGTVTSSTVPSTRSTRTGQLLAGLHSSPVTLSTTRSTRTVQGPEIPTLNTDANQTHVTSNDTPAVTDGVNTPTLPKKRLVKFNFTKSTFREEIVIPHGTYEPIFDVLGLPMQYFKTMFSDDFFSHIVSQSNIYVMQKRQAWQFYRK